jgi:hypothetical protein
MPERHVLFQVALLLGVVVAHRAREVLDTNTMPERHVRLQLNGLFAWSLYGLCQNGYGQTACRTNKQTDRQARRHADRQAVSTTQIVCVPANGS